MWSVTYFQLMRMPFVPGSPTPRWQNSWDGFTPKCADAPLAVFTHPTPTAKTRVLRGALDQFRGKE